MSLFTTNTYWADRLFTQKDQFNYWKDAMIFSVKEKFDKYVTDLFNKRIFSKSIIVRKPDETLSFISMDKKMYSLSKGILMSFGIVCGIVVYLLSMKEILTPLILVIPIFAIAGYIFPELYVLDKAQQKEVEIHNDFPRFLDLLHIYTSTAAFEHIGNAMHAISSNMTGALSNQLRSITGIYRFVDANSFLDQFEIRFDTPLARDLVSTLKLADMYGGNISEKIGVLADEAHKERMQNAKQKGQKASAMLLIPLMLFHFPVAIIIFLAPTALALKQVFGW